MEVEIIQEQTKGSPGISFTPDDSLLRIGGRSIPENPESVYRPLYNWVDEYFKGDGSLKVEIILEYINSGSSKHLLEVLRQLKDYRENGRELSITWFYEEDDESILELGEYYRDASGIPVNIEMIIP
jgi:hypothetical protein